MLDTPTATVGQTDHNSLAAALPAPLISLYQRLTARTEMHRDHTVQQVAWHGVALLLP